MKIWLRERSLPWILLFLTLGLANVQIGGTNAAARISGLRAITEGGTLNTDHYHQWSADWSLSPNGHYYPNKAPGGVLFGLPIFALIDFPTRWLQHAPLDADGRAPPPDLTELALLSLFMQMIPFTLLVAYVGRRFGSAMENGRAQYFFLIAALFGNTAALYMNCYFGIGLAAIFMLAVFVCWLQGRYALASAFLSACLLVDYGAACMIPFFIGATLWRERSLRPLTFIGFGALPCVALWCWYHWTAFGSPFVIATRFSNPDQLEALDLSALGSIQFFPSLFALGKLFFGPERGVLYTQPWVLALFPLCFARVRLPRGSKLFLCGGLCGLWWMGAWFAWDGGATLGPRYLALLFPSVALALALAWRDLSRPWHLLLTLGLFVSVAFRILTFPFSLLPPIVNLWGYHLFLYGQPGIEPDPFPLLELALAGFAIASVWAYWIERSRKVEISQV